MKKVLGIVLMIILFGGIGYYLGIKYPPTSSPKEEETTTTEKNRVGKTFTRTYHIYHIADSNDYKYLYITIRAFQDEEIETVKVERSLFENAKVEDAYEITFEITNDQIEDNIKSIFNNSKIVKAMKTDKLGLEQITEAIPK